MRIGLRRCTTLLSCPTLSYPSKCGLRYWLSERSEREVSLINGNRVRISNGPLTCTTALSRISQRCKESCAAQQRATPSKRLMEKVLPSRCTVKSGFTSSGYWERSVGDEERESDSTRALSASPPFLYPASYARTHRGHLTRAQRLGAAWR